MFWGRALVGVTLQIELEFRKIGVLRKRGKPEYPDKLNHIRRQAREWNRATLVVGKSSYHCAITVPPKFSFFLLITCKEMKFQF